MRSLSADGSEGPAPVQAAAAPGRRALAALLAGVAITLSGCGGQNLMSTPASWWHDLQGGEIAATRPPPPGADLPYPKLGTVPKKPVLPTQSYRDTVEAQLAQERDDTQRLAARNPIVIPKYEPPPQDALPPPPPAPAKPAAPGSPAPGAAGASPDNSDTTASATLPGADAPPPKPAPATPASVAASDGGPAPGTPVTVAGAMAEAPGLVVPDAPPAPASFEGVPALPALTPPPPLPPRKPPGASGKQVLFATGSAVLDPSQTETLNDAVAHRAGGQIFVEGHGETLSDAPSGQEAALGLALERAQAVATKLEKMGVPQNALVLSVTAFGRGASVKAVPAPAAAPAGPPLRDKSLEHQTHPDHNAAGVS